MTRIYADDRENGSGVIEALRKLGVIVIIDRLSVGDYVISDEVAVERKTVADLVNSVYDKRFFDQLNRLSQSYRKPFLIIEGNLGNIKRITPNWKAINSALIAASLDFDIRLIYSETTSETAEILEKIAKRYQSPTKRAITLHEKPKFDSLYQVQKYVLEAFPNVGPSSAEKLLSNFKSLIEVFNANVSDLEKVVGRKRAESIYSTLRASSRVKNKEGEVKSLKDFLETSE